MAIATVPASSPRSGCRGGASPRITWSAACRPSRRWRRLSGRSTSSEFRRDGNWCGEPRSDGPAGLGLAGPGRLLWAAATLACLASATLAAWRLAKTSRQGRSPRWRPCCCCPSPRSWRPTPCSARSFTCGCCRWRRSCWFRPARASRATRTCQRRRAAWCIVFATVIVPVFYPNREYGTGLGLWRTAVLLLRNGVLIYATVSLWAAVRKIERAADSGQP